MSSGPEPRPLLLRNAHAATMADAIGYGGIRDAALLIDADERIGWLGRERDLPAGLDAASEFDCDGGWITPGLIDCHTHLVYAGNRSDEFEERLGGTSYAEIAARGGGIQRTVQATRAAGFDALLNGAVRRARTLVGGGVTRIEVKSGYGLDLATERRMLRVARAVADHVPLNVHTTFLGAHALPPEFSGNADGYVDHVCDEMLPALADEGLVDAVDGFCEEIGFTRAQIERVFETARGLGLPVKLHAEQLSDQRGAALVAEYGGLSADHLEYIDVDDIPALAAAGTVATLLPGAFYYLRETRLPPVDALREAGVPMALATDHNPGSSPVLSLPLCMNMACVLFGLRPDEALAGVTRNAARALGVADRCGRLETGLRAELALWEIERPGDLAYEIGAEPCRRTFSGRAGSR